MRANEPRPRSQTKVEARIATLPTHELSQWADRYLYTVGRGLSEYSKDPARKEFLDEAVEGSQILARILEALQERLG